MTERLTQEEEHPVYWYVMRAFRPDDPVVLKNMRSGEYYGSGLFDAYVFFPRVQIVSGRPDWLFRLPGRNPVVITDILPKRITPSLLQAFVQHEPDSAIPIDQLFVTDSTMTATLSLPRGTFRVRLINEHGAVLWKTQLTNLWTKQGSTGARKANETRSSNVSKSIQ